jgi:hypothetical protein
LPGGLSCLCLAGWAPMGPADSWLLSAARWSPPRPFGAAPWQLCLSGGTRTLREG